MDGIPKRQFGITGEEISIIGLGGAHIGMADMSPKQAVCIIHRALDRESRFWIMLGKWVLLQRIKCL